MLSQSFTEMAAGEPDGHFLEALKRTTRSMNIMLLVARGLHNRHSSKIATAKA